MIFNNSPQSGAPVNSGTPESGSSTLEESIKNTNKSLMIEEVDITFYNLKYIK